MVPVLLKRMVLENKRGPHFLKMRASFTNAVTMV